MLMTNHMYCHWVVKGSVCGGCGCSVNNRKHEAHHLSKITSLKCSTRFGLYLGVFSSRRLDIAGLICGYGDWVLELETDDGTREGKLSSSQNEKSQYASSRFSEADGVFVRSTGYGLQGSNHVINAGTLSAGNLLCGKIVMKDVRVCCFIR